MFDYLGGGGCRAGRNGGVGRPDGIFRCKIVKLNKYKIKLDFD